MTALEKIGKGEWKTVSALDEKTARITFDFKAGNISDKNPENYVRTMYLLQTIAHELFPDAIPAAIGVGRTEEGKPYVDVERVPHDAYHASVADSDKNDAKNEPPEHNAHEVDYYHNLRDADNDYLGGRLFSADMSQAGLGGVMELGGGLNYSFHEGKKRYLDMELRPGRSEIDPALLKKAIEKIPDVQRKEKTMRDFDELTSIISPDLLRRK